MKPIILASASEPRRSLLARLGVDFTVRISGVDETPRGGETVAAMVARLARAKAQAIAAAHPKALILGCDQAADVGGEILGKPADADAAARQLSLCSDNVAIFHTCVCLLDATDDRSWIRDVITKVHFRRLNGAEITRYIEREKPFECAGSFRCESLGIALFERVESEDPTALHGLPLIAVCRMLRQAGVELP